MTTSQAFSGSGVAEQQIAAPMEAATPSSTSGTGHKTVSEAFSGSGLGVLDLVPGIRNLPFAIKLLLAAVVVSLIVLVIFPRFGNWLNTATKDESVQRADMEKKILSDLRRQTSVNFTSVQIVKKASGNYKEFAQSPEGHLAALAITVDGERFNWALDGPLISPSSAKRDEKKD